MVVPVPDSGMGAALGYSRGERPALPVGPHPQPLRRAHVHRAQAVDPVLRGQDQAQPGARASSTGKRVVLIDDSIVRGTTSRKIVGMVREAGAREVHMRISSPPTIGPCYYGIDTPLKSELIASSPLGGGDPPEHRRGQPGLPLARGPAGRGRRRARASATARPASRATTRWPSPRPRTGSSSCSRRSGPSRERALPSREHGRPVRRSRRSSPCRGAVLGHPLDRLVRCRLRARACGQSPRPPRPRRGVVPLVPRDGGDDLPGPGGRRPDPTRFVAVHVDQDARPDLSNRYEDYGWPATVIFDAAGRELVKFQGYIEPERMRGAAAAVIADPTPGPSVANAARPVRWARAPRSPSAERRDLQAILVNALRHEARRLGDFAQVPGLGQRRVVPAARARGRSRRRAHGARDARPPAQAHRSRVGRRLPVLRQRRLGPPALREDHVDAGGEPAPLRPGLRAAGRRAVPAGGARHPPLPDDVPARAGRRVLREPGRGRRARRALRRVLQAGGRRAAGPGRAARGHAPLHARDGVGGHRAPRASRGDGRGGAAPRRRPVRRSGSSRTARIDGGGFRHDAMDVAGPYLGDSVAAARLFLALYAATGERPWLRARGEDAAPSWVRASAARAWPAW